MKYIVENGNILFKLGNVMAEAAVYQIDSHFMIANILSGYQTQFYSKMINTLDHTKTAKANILMSQIVPLLKIRLVKL